MERKFEEISERTLPASPLAFFLMERKFGDISERTLRLVWRIQYSVAGKPACGRAAVASRRAGPAPVLSEVSPSIPGVVNDTHVCE